MKRLMVLLVALFLCACAGSNLVTRDQFMARAGQFDVNMKGQEQTTKYKECYGQFMFNLYVDCKPLINHDGGAELAYWTCADRQLDSFDECMNGGAE